MRCLDVACTRPVLTGVTPPVRLRSGLPSGRARAWILLVLLIAVLLIGERVLVQADAPRRVDGVRRAALLALEVQLVTVRAEDAFGRDGVVVRMAANAL